MIIRSLFMAILLFSLAKAQTFVSGGIFSDTTWTKANSPYIVTSTVIVMPGVELTIEPGVTVKYQGNYGIEIRKGKLTAVGTQADSITFLPTSPPVMPKVLFIHLNEGTLVSQFDYCHFDYALSGIICSSINYNLFISHSLFTRNTCGVSLEGTSSTIEDCSFKGNKTGISNSPNTIARRSFFSYNATGISLVSALLTDQTKFSDNTWGIRNATSATISSCGFFSNGIGIGKVSEAIHLDNCILLSNLTGIEEPRSGTVSNSRITLNDNAIFRPGDISILNNSITSNSVAIFRPGGCRIVHNVIDSNEYGIHDSYSSSIIDNEINRNRKVAIDLGGDSVMRNRIRFNGVGIYAPNSSTAQSVSNIIIGNIIESDSIGLLVGFHDVITCNRIAFNTAFDMKYTGTYKLSPAQYGMNDWNSTDSATVATRVYDGADDLNLGLVQFMPLDVTQCYLTVDLPVNNVADGLQLYPNPSDGNCTVTSGTDCFYKIYNIQGVIVDAGELTSLEPKNIHLSVRPGLYQFCATAKGKLYCKKLIITR